jgi:hypothetical protein
LRKLRKVGNWFSYCDKRQKEHSAIPEVGFSARQAYLAT